jgi:hypothetical protein
MVGSGTAQDPFQVVTASDLQKVASGVDGWDDDAHYVQVADIDMEQVYSYINVFNGVYDGRGHVIENVKATGAKAVIRGAAKVEKQDPAIAERLDRAEKRLAELEGKLSVN